MSGTAAVSGVSVHSVVAFVLLAAGYVMLRPDWRPVSLLFARGVGGMMARRLVPSAVTVLIMVAVLIALTGRWGGLLQGFDIMVATGVLLAVMYVALLRTALLLDRIGTEQQRLTQTVTYERDLNHTILDALQDGVIAAERDGTAVAVNDRMCELLGLPADEILGQRPPYTWIAPGQDSLAWPARDTALTHQIRIQDEIEILRSDGTRLEVARSTSAASTGGRDATLYVTAYRDLTERNQVRAERRVLADRLDHFFDMSTELLCIAGTDGYFKHLNPAWEQVLGHPVAELMSRPYVAFVHPDDQADTDRETHELQSAVRGSASFENRYLHADGSYRWLCWNSTPALEGGFIYAVARDITDEHAERSARAELAAIVDSTDDAVISKTPEGIITSWNNAAASIYGYTAAEAIGRHSSLIYPPDEWDDVDSTMAKVLRGESVRDHERIGLRKDGTAVHVSLTISPLRDAGGTIRGVSSIGRDVTDRIREQQDLAAARDAALAADRAKSEFVAMVSHEIRTPLNGIIGLNTLMLRTELQRGQRRFANGIDASAKALLAIINDVLDFSKIEAGKIELALADFDIADIVADALRIAAENARSKNLEVIGYYPPDLHRIRHGDAGRIRQVLINLLGNAVKFTQEGHVRLDVTAEGDECRFTVTDTGIGIEATALAGLFEPFVQAEQSSNRSYGGTGLGLTISRQLVALLGGALDARSEPGVGSCFTFGIPLPSRDASAMPPRRPRGNELIGRRLLIADASSSARDIYAEHARFWGMIVTTADDADEAIRYSPDSPVAPDVITIDSQLCENAEVGAVLRQLTSAPGAPFVVLLSADPAEADRIAQSTGIAEVLQKPVDPSAYYNCLTGLFQARGHQPETGRQSPGIRDVPARGRVLVAEDNEINQIVAEDLLTAMGYQIDMANNGEEALELVAANDYVAVLMDCQMPKVDGYEATRRLRRGETGARRLPIIAMTAGAMAIDRQRCLDAGMDDCVTKPVDPGNLERVLVRWTSEARHQGAP